MTYEVKFLGIVGRFLDVIRGAFPVEKEMKKLKDIFRMGGVLDRSLGFSKTVIWHGDWVGSECGETLCKFSVFRLVFTTRKK